MQDKLRDSRNTKRKFHDFLTLLTSTENVEFGVPEGASSNPARVNSFFVDVGNVRKS